MKLFRLVKALRNRLEIRMAPLKYSKRVGVNFIDEELKLYGPIRWDSEPLMIP